MNKNHEKMLKLELKGDQWLKKGKLKDAFKSYRKALTLDSEHLPLYDKLIESQKKLGKELTHEEFAESLGWTMKKQELENPAIKRVHAKLEPEWNEIMEAAKQMMMVIDEKTETECVEKIAAHGSLAVYPLVEMLLTFKKFGKK